MGISKLLFVEPPRNYWFVMGEYLPPPSALLILAAYIERELPEIEIEVLDCQAERMNWQSLEKYIESSQPSIVLTSGFTCNAYTCIRTCEIAKKVDEHIITVAGGIHFSFTPEESLICFPEIDIIVRGEGELTLVDLLQTLHKKGMEIGNHSHTHRLLNTLSKKEQLNEIRTSNFLLTDLCNKRPLGFSYPYGQYNSTTIKLLQGYGYKYAVTTDSQNLFKLGRIDTNDFH